jgi:acetyl-CoA carboxylase biotin carboxyl carrier protein
VTSSRRRDPLDLKELKQILQMLDEEQITEFELESEGMKLRIKKQGGAPAPVVGVAPAPLAAAVAPTPAPAREPPPPAVEEGLLVVKSPIVGTFYRSPDPNAPAFVSVGDRVKPGQVLCIVEAMKLMNEIEAEVAGEIVEIHKETGQPIQFGDPLFTLRPDR